MAPLVAHRSQGKAHPLPISPIRVTVYIVLEALLSRLVLALPRPPCPLKGVPVVRIQSTGSGSCQNAGYPPAKLLARGEKRESCEKRETGSEANTPPGLAQKVWLT